MVGAAGGRQSETARRGAASRPSARSLSSPPPRSARARRPWRAARGGEGRPPPGEGEECERRAAPAPSTPRHTTPNRFLRGHRWTRVTEGGRAGLRAWKAGSRRRGVGRERGSGAAPRKARGALAQCPGYYALRALECGTEGLGGSCACLGGAAPAGGRPSARRAPTGLPSLIPSADDVDVKQGAPVAKQGVIVATDRKRGVARRAGRRARRRGAAAALAD